MTIIENPFEELPGALVDELFKRSKQIATEMNTQFSKIFDQKEKILNVLIEKGILHNINDLPIQQAYPTSAGIDGAYAIERLISTDFACVAGVAVEGLTPPGPEKRFWPNPRFFSHVDLTSHNEATSQILRGMSVNMELQLAVKAPHDVVFLDGSFVTYGIFLNNATVALDEGPFNLKEVFLNGKQAENEDKIKFPGFLDGLTAYKEILSSKRTDKIFAAIPKYTTKNEVCQLLGMDSYEDRSLLNFVLKGDEYVGPLQLKNDIHIKVPSNIKDSETIKNLINEITQSLFPKVRVIYYRPASFTPVLRIEISDAVANNRNRLAILLKALQIQCVSASIMEPYPLYLADRMVKHLSTALPAIRTSATQEALKDWKGETGDIYLATKGYRTEWS